MRNIRTTFQPGTIRKVSESEFTDLDRQGLVLEVVMPKAPVAKPHPVPIKVTTATAGEGNNFAGGK